MLNIEKYKDEIKAEINKDKILGCVVNKLMGNTCDDYLKCNDCYLEELDWLLQEYKEPILNDKEKVIIKDIIKAFEPFGKKLIYITKFSWNNETKGYYLNFEYKGDNFDTFNFSEDEFFVGMKLDKAYTPEELGL